MSTVFEQALDLGEPKRLLIFGAIAESGSIGAAARELGWSQPALSQHMNALEKDLDVTLFDRTPDGAQFGADSLQVACHCTITRLWMLN